MKKRQFILVTGLAATLMVLVVFSCTKQKSEPFEDFAKVTFKNYSTVDPKISIVYKEKLADSIGLSGGLSRGLSVVAGQGRFQFVKKETGKILLDTLLNIAPGSKDTLNIFRIDTAQKLVFIKTPSADGIAPPAPGNLKLSIANFASIVLPDKVDVILLQRASLRNQVYTAVDTIENVGKGFTEFHEIKRIVSTDLIGMGTLVSFYTLRFLDSRTKQPILSKNGLPYSANGFGSNLPGKPTLATVISVYFADYKGIFCTPGQLYDANDNCYNINSTIFFSK